MTDDYLLRESEWPPSSTAASVTASVTASRRKRTLHKQKRSTVIDDPAEDEVTTFDAIESTHMEDAEAAIARATEAVLRSNGNIGNFYQGIEFVGYR
jgi:hypothetical protein